MPNNLYSIRTSQEKQFWDRVMCLNSKKPEQDFLLGTKSKRIWMEGILQGPTAQTGRLWQGRHSWPQAEHSLAGALRHCQTGEGRRTGAPFPPLQRAAGQTWTGRNLGCTTTSTWECSWLYCQVPTTSRGAQEKAQHQRDGASPPASPDSAEEGAREHQPLQRWDSKHLLCHQDSNRLQDIHLDTFIS